MFVNKLTCTYTHYHLAHDNLDYSIQIIGYDNYVINVRCKWKY